MIKQITSLLNLLKRPLIKILIIASAGLFEGFSFAIILLGVEFYNIENTSFLINILPALLIIFTLRFIILLYANKLKSSMVYGLKARLQKNLLTTFISDKNKIQKVANQDLDFALQRFSIHSQEVSANYIFPFLNIMSEIPLQAILLGVMLVYNFKLVLVGLVISFLLLLVLRKITSSINNVSRIRSANEGKAIKSFMFLRNNEYTLSLNKNINFAINDIQEFIDNGAREAEKGLFYQFLPKNIIESAIIILLLFTSLVYLYLDIQIDFIEIGALIGVTMFRVLPGIYRFYSLWLAMKSTQHYVDEIQTLKGKKYNDYEVRLKIKFNEDLKNGFNVLTGDSGTGKSQFIQGYINKQLRKMSGKIEVFYLDTYSTLFSGSLEENINYFVPKKNIEEVNTLNKILKVIENIKGKDFTRRIASASDISEINLSSGEIKLILCVFGVHSGLSLAILDEATANLDKDIERQVIDLFQSSSEIQKIIFVRHGYHALPSENEITFG